MKEDFKEFKIIVGRKIADIEEKIGRNERQGVRDKSVSSFKNINPQSHLK